MRLGILHLSDIHFRRAGNPVEVRAHAIASAAASEDPTVDFYLVVVSGDVAFSGNAEEYEVAKKFFAELRTHLQSVQNRSEVTFIGVPGNHDCYLPENGETLRNALISAITPSLNEPNPDPVVLEQLLNVQSNYSAFHNLMYAGGAWDGVCTSWLIDMLGAACAAVARGGLDSAST